MLLLLIHVRRQRRELRIASASAKRVMPWRRRGESLRISRRGRARADTRRRWHSHMRPRLLTGRFRNDKWRRWQG